MRKRLPQPAHNGATSRRAATCWFIGSSRRTAAGKSAGERERLGRDAHRQFFVAPDEARINALRLADHLDAIEALQNLFPDDFQLQIGEPHAETAVDTEAERHMDARLRAIDNEIVRAFDHILVAIAGDVPHNDAVALPDALAVK